MKTKPLPTVVLASKVAFAPPLAAVAQTDASAGTVAATTEAGTNTETAQKMATPAPEMQAVLDKLAELGAKPLHMLTPDEARAQPTPADAVAAVMASVFAT